MEANCIQCLFIVKALTRGETIEKIGPNPFNRERKSMEQRYNINRTKSEIRLLLYKDSTLLSPLAHNHVIITSEIYGEILFNPENVCDSSFSLSIPVASLIVDPTKQRYEEGDDFSSKISDRDIKKTCEIMLDKNVLFAKNFPQITLESSQISGTLPAVQVTTQTCVRGAVKELKIPAHVEVEGSEMHIKGELDLKQTDFKIKPVSVLLGSIKLQDRFIVKFDLYAEM
ncbi:YceI family protein [Deltaproteobacteria bacterium TL4]